MPIRILEYQSLTSNVQFARSSEDNKLSMLVGANGAGKSRILFEIASLFEIFYEAAKGLSVDRSLKDAANRGYTKSHSSLKYKIDTHDITIGLLDGSPTMLKDNIPIGIDPSYLPNRVLAFAHLPTDKFPFRRRQLDERYRYLGLRQTGNMVSTTALTTKIIESVLLCSLSTERKRAINRVLKQLGLQRSPAAQFRLRLDPAMYSKFDGDSEKLIEEIILTSRPRDTASIDNAIIRSAAKLAIHSGRIIPPQKDLSRANILVEFDLLADSSTEALLQSIQTLRDQRIFIQPELAFKRSDDKQVVHFSELSSGDQQILGTLVRLSAESVEKSVVLIDEPEVSLHPKRQQEYVPELYKCVPFIDSCSVIMATHSHLMVSNLPNNSSVVVRKTVTAGFRSFRPMRFSANGLPSEQVLYQVFGIDASSSLYAVADVKAALSFAQKQRLSGQLTEDEMDELKEIHQRLGNSGASRSPIVIEVMPLIESMLSDA